MRTVNATANFVYDFRTFYTNTIQMEINDSRVDQVNEIEHQLTDQNQEGLNRPSEEEEKKNT